MKQKFGLANIVQSEDFLREIDRAAALSYKHKGESGFVVYVDENFLNKIPKAQESEQDMIDFVQDADKSSRLSCQIIITNDLDGIVVRMPKKQS